MFITMSHAVCQMLHLINTEVTLCNKARRARTDTKIFKGRVTDFPDVPRQRLSGNQT